MLAARKRPVRKTVFIHSHNQRGPAVFGIRIERKDYFRIDITGELFQEFADGQTPSAYKIDWQLKTYAFLISTKWTVERSHADSFAVADYDNWAKQLSHRIQEFLIN